MPGLGGEQCLNHCNTGGVVEGEAACWQESPWMLPHTHRGCLLIVSCEWGWASQFSSWLNTAPCGLLNMSPGIKHLWSNNGRLYNVMSLSFPVKQERHSQTSEGEEAYQGTDTCMRPYRAALEEKRSFSLYYFTSVGILLLKVNYTTPPKVTQ